MFVCIEGTDASGKNTQTKILGATSGVRVVSFPSYDTPVGKLIKKHLMKEISLTAWSPLHELSNGRVRMSPDEIKNADSLMFQALQTVNRLEMVKTIKGYLEAGNVVVADRYWPSAVVYGTLDGLNSEYLKSLHTTLPQPDLFILLDVDYEDSLARRPDRRDRYEADQDMMKKVSEEYRRLWSSMKAESNFHHWVVVDGRQGVPEVTMRLNHLISECQVRLSARNW